MKIVQINAYYGIGSTGKICYSISELLNKEGIENYVLYTQGNPKLKNGVNYGCGQLYTKVQSLKSRVFGNNGFNSHIITKRLIKKLDGINPDIIHLHNLHAQNINWLLFFEYVKKKHIKLYWTFHDCWTFTGYCMYFDRIGCKAWKSGCGHCRLRKKYSWFFDLSNYLLQKKIECFQKKNVSIITPSYWLASMVRNSLINYGDLRVIYNGINLDVFQPIQSDYRKKNDLDQKCILLGVADLWDKRKGIDVFVHLAARLDYNKYQIILVGTNDKIDRLLPKNIISIHHTNNQHQLAELYSAADIFVNPTREETLGMVNIEALACGTPVVTFDSGGSPECLDKSCGIVVEKDDIKSMCDAIERLYDKKSILMGNCINRAKQFDQKNKLYEYINMYRE